MIDGEWVQRWALWQLWLAEIGRQLCVSSSLTGRHYSLLWFSGVLSHNYSQLVCVCELVDCDPFEFPPGFLSTSLTRDTDDLTDLHAEGRMAVFNLLTRVFAQGQRQNHSHTLWCERANTWQTYTEG